MRISVLDPGLEKPAGHHMALLEYLADNSDQENIVDYYCSRNLDIHSGALSSYMSKVSIQPTFSGNFYQYYNKDIKYTGANAYVLSLAEEYFQTLSKLGRFSNKVNVLLPTLLWEHALAFDQGLQRFKKESPEVQINIVVLLMFSPVSFVHIGSGSLELNFKMAFRALANHSEIQFYASDQETMDEYKRIFNDEVSLGLHPCFLINKNSECVKLPKTYVIGYLGDAKEEKGFLLLLDLVDEFVSNENQHTLLIQYTLESSCPKLLAVERQLTSKAACYGNIEVVKGYLPYGKLHNYLANSAQIMLNYDDIAYRNKTSGIVWLAVHYAISLTCSKNTWMWREYVRLTGTTNNAKKNVLVNALALSSSSNKYYLKIFSPYLPWLVSRFSSAP